MHTDKKTVQTDVSAKRTIGYKLAEAEDVETDG
jgi:hypothetical protein